MNPICDRCDTWLQEMLDGNEPDGVVQEHLVGCVACRELYESAVSLRQGLALMPAPQPPVGMENRVVAAVLQDRRRRVYRRRYVFGAVAMAAAILIAVLLSNRSTPVPQPQPNEIVKKPDEPIPSLRETVSMAGSAVADLTTRKVDEALETTRKYLDVSPLPMIGITTTVEPTAKPLQTASQGVSAGLEPVADKARRAFALFVRDLPTGGLMNKPGL